MKPLPLDDETLTEVQKSFQSALGLVLVIVPENLLQLCLELYIRHIPFEFVGGGRERVLQRFQHCPLDLLRNVRARSFVLVCSTNRRTCAGVTRETVRYTGGPFIVCCAVAVRPSDVPLSGFGSTSSDEDPRSRVIGIPLPTARSPIGEPTSAVPRLTIKVSIIMCMHDP